MPSSAVSAMPSRSCTWFAGTKTSPPEYADTPPSFGAFSSTRTFAPRSCAAMAAESPPIPEPTTTTSTDASHLLRPKAMARRSRDHPAVDDDGRAVDVRRVVRGQERDGARDFLRLAHATERHDAAERCLADPLGERELPDERRLDSSRADAVDPHVLPAVLDGERACELDDAPLGSAVRGAVRVRLEAGDGARVDDGALGLQDVRDGFLAHQELTREVDRDHPVPLLERRLRGPAAEA